MLFDMAGHEILLAGGPYVTDHGDPYVRIHCCECPDGTSDGWVLWSDPDELGEHVDINTAVPVIVDHLRADGLDVPEELVAAAFTMAAFKVDPEAALEEALDLIAEQLRAAG